jgi:hypothetical protein
MGGGSYGPLSNYDLSLALKNINNFRGVFSRDNLPFTIRNDESGVINLDSSSGPGTHWVCYFNRQGLKHVYYFDSYGLPPPEEIKKYLHTSNKQILYNTGEIQQIGTNLCGVYCVHFIKELNKGRDFYDILYDNFEPYPTDENEMDIRDITDKYHLNK